ncbi:hypothetical protein [Metabacillus bambusae]|uniref:Uncharacterized protein n=1 Tax=Metabacillus bambusae TaxID=2795218 RepID=A0ABS3N060_9BACI|nr:hypothetical protein [Metabacillus bambusae]MBO1511550.1 hypothetical protein [Metabacillus bambusae]
MNLFKKTTDMEKLTGERDSLQAQAQEVQGKISQVSNALNMAKVEYMVEGTASIKKKVDKYESAIQGFQKELEGLNKKLQAVGEELAKLNSEKRKQELNEMAERDVEGFERIYRAKKLEKFRNDTLYYALQKQGIGNSSAGRPRELYNDAGVTGGNHFDPKNPEHAPYSELWDSKKNEATSRVDAELEELIKKINEFIGQ